MKKLLLALALSVMYSTAAAAQTGISSEGPGSVPCGGTACSVTTLATTGKITGTGDNVGATFNATGAFTGNAIAFQRNSATTLVIQTAMAADGGCVGTAQDDNCIRGISKAIRISGDNGASTGLLVSATNVLSAPVMGTDAAQTDATVCRVTVGGALLTGTGAIGICLGTSTRREKTDIQLITATALSSIMNLQPVSYYKKSDTVRIKRDYWLIAEDTEKVLPECVAYGEKHQVNSIDQICIQTFMLKAMQEQQRQIEAVQKQISNDTLWSHLKRMIYGL
jgi:hypothetical protein